MLIIDACPASRGRFLAVVAGRILDMKVKSLWVRGLKRGLMMTVKDKIYGVDKWVRRQAALHTTPESIRRRIAYEREQVRILVDPEQPTTD